MAFAQFPVTGGSFPLLAPDGLVSAPSISFASSSNSGFYFATGFVRFALGGQEVQRWQLSDPLKGSQFVRPFSWSAQSVATATSITALTSSTNCVFLTGSTTTTLSGIAAMSAPATTQPLWVINSSTATVSIAHQDVAAAAADRIITFSGVNRNLPADHGAMFVYDTTASRWRLILISA